MGKSLDDKVKKFPDWKIKDTNEWCLHPPNQYITPGLFDNSGSPSLFNTINTKSRVDTHRQSKIGNVR